MDVKTASTPPVTPQPTLDFSFLLRIEEQDLKDRIAQLERELATTQSLLRIWEASQRAESNERG